jgi:hypothetical protein
MPWKVFRDGENFCVHKLTPAGDKGERVACHETEEQADAQIAALNIAESERSVFVVRAIDAEQGIIEGALMLWGSPGLRDDYGTWADPEAPPNLGLEVLPRMLYEHGADSDVQRATIGKLTKVWVDGDGFKFRAQLDRAGKWFRRIIDEIKGGLLKVSSASAEHLADFDDWGRFRDWLLTEVSLTKSPAEPRMPSVALLRSGKEIQQPAPTGDAPRARGDVADMQKSNERNKRKRNMDESILKAIDPALMQPLQALVDEWGADVIAAAIAALMGDGEEMLSEEDATAAVADPEVMLSKVRAYLEEKAKEQKADDLAEQVAALKEQVEQATLRAQTEPEKEDEPSFEGAPGTLPQIRVGDKWDPLTAAEMATAYVAMRALRPYEKRSEEFLRATMTKIIEDANRTGGDRRQQAYSRAARKSVYDRTIPFTRAGDVNAASITGYGEEWVGVFYEDSLWETVRFAPIWQTMRELGLNEKDIPRGYASNVIPIEGDDPTWYVVPETTTISADGTPKVNVPSSAESTSTQTVTVKKIGALMTWSEEATEDMIIDIAQESRRKLEVTAQERIEYLLVNGDTTTTASTNINLIDGTPDANTIYLALNGMLKLPLVTNTANARDAGTTLDENDYLDLWKLLGTNGVYANDPNRIMWIVDNLTHIASLKIPSVKTRDVYIAPTLEAGSLARLWNVRLFISGQMALANSSGKISATAANNTRGRILLVRPDQWWLAWKRQMSTEVVRYPVADATQIVTFMRLGLQYRDTDASATSYNVNVS